ncbi:hypothetical protein [Reichenbachiella versicolor]|uniref:hypothetical protein n=1 Tax=Reichenbachiella versicolor TaxID=1821036 RepID=UPI0013A55D60|nr:hypothetical protein [Reichenbachiella versicolor]
MTFGFGMILTLFFFYSEEYTEAKATGIVSIGSLICYFLIPNKKIKVDHSGNAIKKKK